MATVLTILLVTVIGSSVVTVWRHWQIVTALENIAVAAAETESALTKAIEKAARAEKLHHDHLQAMLTSIGDMAQLLVEKQGVMPVAPKVVKATGWAAIRSANERFNRDQELERERAEENTSYEPAS